MHILRIPNSRHVVCFGKEFYLGRASDPSVPEGDPHNPHQHPVGSYCHSRETLCIHNLTNFMSTCSMERQQSQDPYNLRKTESLKKFWISLGRWKKTHTLNVDAKSLPGLNVMFSTFRNQKSNQNVKNRMLKHRADLTGFHWRLSHNQLPLFKKLFEKQC